MEFTGGWKGPYPDESAYSMAARMAMYVITSSHYLTGIRMFEKNRPLAQYLVKPLKRSDLIRWGLEENDGHWADPYLVACAMEDSNLIIISEESSRKKPERKIPYVCNEKGIRCIKVLEFLREIEIL